MSAKLIKVATCDMGSCPTIYELEDSSDDVVVQGYTFEHDTPSGEQSVRIPKWLLAEGAKQVSSPTDS